ncbi:hypothetical protein Pmar_PMAR022473 [Perkinsus marinus ATCC 50983]|uniref:DOT1 domain-containing protein n=1 Tax=Perkinsus marinus (strain ATCC 50983 / TXsc) TaxID=423536 RepID=C5L1S8_PERM5|nr:hypothetical protein Pmar_PMAR022473 [Perkinsus marinus ATCC 50983]EER09314.1 hypothetical protein Pmar_PMAR022473 [Perkinsus marinus ATCC 50983]|eukprot:XP_002777498.1 hypothetical protein Pmar_PMAR022473 [Perkinsus marinus ATCC 50983]
MSEEVITENNVVPPEGDVAKELYERTLAGYRPKHGKRIAKAYRAKGDANEDAELTPTEVHDPSLTYAETTLTPMRGIMAAVVDKVGVVSGSTCFLDIGSGVGTAVLAASARHKFRKAVGIECVPELVAKSNELRDSFLSNLLPPSGEDGEAACESAMPEVTSNVEFIEGEAFEEITKLLEDASEFLDRSPAPPEESSEEAETPEGQGDSGNDVSCDEAEDQVVKPKCPLVIYWLSTCFSDDLVQAKAISLSKVTPKNTVLILVTHLLRRDAALAWGLEAEIEMEFDWGMGTVFIYRNVSEESPNDSVDSSSS